MWTELLTALALVFVLEGLIPFLSPDGYKRYVAQIVELPSAGELGLRKANKLRR